MKTEFMVAITQLSAEKNLPKEVVLAAVESALVSAYRKDTFSPNQDILVRINPSTGEVKVYVQRTVAEAPTDSLCEISLAEARKLNRTVQIGEIVNIESTPPNAGRIAAQTARQVILQRLHEAEHHVIFEEFSGREGDITTGIVQRITPERIHIGLGRAEAILPVNEQVYNERYRVGQRLKVYILDVTGLGRGPQILVSRSHRNLLRRLFELEIPEICSGVVEIKAVAREAGYRSKVAVAALQDGIDPVGCCVGLRGIRIQNIVNELNGEKIDMVQWAEESAVFIANALSPAQVSNVNLNEAAGTAIVIVPDKKLSLAIGKEGQNARLAAKLTGWRIDIKSASAVEAETGVSEEEAKEVVTEEVITEEKIAPEFVAEEGLISESVVSEEPLISEPVSEVAAQETEVVTDDYELVLTSEVLPTDQPKEASKIRFAEDILPARSPKAARKKKTRKDDKESRGESKSKKVQLTQVSYSEEEEIE